MQELIERLQQSGCSLVVCDSLGQTTTYNKKGVRDLVWLLDNEPWRLQGAYVADKVVGKAAAGLMVCANVANVYGMTMSRQALPLFDDAGIPYEYEELVDAIIIPEGDNRCPLEQIVEDAVTAEDVELLLREHFEEMKNK